MCTSMKLAIPKIAVLDSSTLGKIARDYWSADAKLRDKARKFLAEMLDRCVFIAFTLTHVSELLRHDNEQVVRDRIRFLRSVKLIAWLRPYDRKWFPGAISDLLARELHAVVYRSARGWDEVVQQVRPELWETGSGAEMFVDDVQLWSAIRSESKRQHEHEMYVASVARTEPTGVTNLSLRTLQNMPKRPKEEREDYMQRVAEVMKNQLDCHGDKRLRGTHKIASEFTTERLQDMQAIDALGSDMIYDVLEFGGVPKELVHPEMTVSEIGELAVYASRLHQLGEKLRPPREISMREVPADVMPSYSLERKLAFVQGKAERISGSDLGDSHIVPLIFYADGVEVDKRTLHYLKNICDANSRLSHLSRRFFRSSDYSEIPRNFQQQ